MTDVATTGITAKGLEQVLIGGDLKDLSPADRVKYYESVCRSLGLNPLTKPFDYISLNGKLTLYAKRDCTDQLRKLHGISIVKLVRERLDDVYVVTASAVSGDRQDESLGAVSTAGLKGEALANAMMKAETKAKRRVTLSIVGLGWLDETEVDTVPSAASANVNQETGEITKPAQIPPATVRHEPEPKNENGKVGKVPDRERGEKWYRGLADKADVLDIPTDSHNPAWLLKEVLERGNALQAQIVLKENQLAKAR